MSKKEKAETSSNGNTFYPSDPVGWTDYTSANASLKDDIESADVIKEPTLEPTLKTAVQNHNLEA